jgi:hypothetical protein
MIDLFRGSKTKGAGSSLKLVGSFGIGAVIAIFGKKRYETYSIEMSIVF